MGGMKLATWNVNGIRAAWGKGFSHWLGDLAPDVVCLQEVKAHPEQLEQAMREPGGYKAIWHPAEKKGYSGLCVLTKTEPLSVQKLGMQKFDQEGRVLVVEYPAFTLINAYFPNSQRDHARLGFKLEFCDAMLNLMNTLRAQGKNLLVCGDFNIAHREIDLKNPKENKDNAGFLPQERAWMDRVCDSGYIDTFRQFNKNPEQYTWWSYRPTIRERNIGWRLDYFVANGEFSDRLKSVEHQPHILGSDHCPVFLQLKR